jgi:ATP-binding cassette, subfamily B, bacterial MsbA
MKVSAFVAANKPSEPFPPEITPGNLKKILDAVKPYTLQFAILIGIAVMLSFLTGITQLSLTPLLNIVMNETESPGTSGGLNDIGAIILNALTGITGFTDRWQLFVASTILYLTLALLGQAISFGARAWMIRLRFEIAAELERRLFEHILRLPLSFLHKYPAGWLFSRMDLDVRSATSLLADVILDGLSSLLVSLFYAVLLIKTNLSLTAFAAVAGLIQVGLTQYMSRYTKAYTRGNFETSARTQAFGLERLSAVREVKALAGETYEMEAFRRRLNVWQHVGRRQMTFKRLETPLRWVINRLVLVAVMLYGGWEMVNGRLSTTAYLLFMFFAQSLIGPLSSLAEMMLSLVEFKTTLDGVGYILGQPQESDGNGDQAIKELNDQIVFRDVSFAYEQMPVLRDVNLTIRKGEMIALVGKSGAGKSTLVDLLMRFYVPTGGVIEMDGTPIQQFDLSHFRRLFGVVSQDGLLFNDTVFQNIAYARPDLTREEVERAARIANAQSFILHDLEEGYETLLGERGVRLSGGQRQRIAIARAVAHRPSILILDEATSALDSESERLVQDAISQVVKGHTAIVIAHRLTTILMADQIVVLKDGQIVETGRHQELLDLNGEYRYLYDLQFNDGEIDPSMTGAVDHQAAQP